MTIRLNSFTVQFVDTFCLCKLRDGVKYICAMILDSFLPWEGGSRIALIYLMLLGGGENKAQGQGAAAAGDDDQPVSGSEPNKLGVYRRLTEKLVPRKWAK